MMRYQMLALCVSLLSLPILAWAVQGVEVNGTVLVPLRPVADWLGARTAYQPKEQTVTLQAGGQSIRLVLGERSATVNGSAVKLPLPCVMYAGATYLPLKPLAGKLGASVAWGAKTRTISVTHPNQHTPLTIPVTPATPPNRRHAETLAGLTVGDHPLKAFALWGQFALRSSPYSVKGTQAYYRSLMGKGANGLHNLSIAIDVRGHAIVHIATHLNPDLEETAQIRRLCARLATGRGYRLGACSWEDPGRKLYGRPYLTEQDQWFAEADYVQMRSYDCGDLTIGRTRYIPGPIFIEMGLERRASPSRRR